MDNTKTTWKEKLLKLYYSRHAMSHSELEEWIQNNVEDPLQEEILQHENAVMFLFILFILFLLAQIIVSVVF
jgi:hypothetical protein